MEFYTRSTNFYELNEENIYELGFKKEPHDILECKLAMKRLIQETEPGKPISHAVDTVSKLSTINERSIYRLYSSNEDKKPRATTLLFVSIALALNIWDVMNIYSLYGYDLQSKNMRPILVAITQYINGYNAHYLNEDETHKIIEDAKEYLSKANFKDR